MYIYIYIHIIIGAWGPGMNPMAETCCFRLVRYLKSMNKAMIMNIESLPMARVWEKCTAHI